MIRWFLASVLLASAFAAVPAAEPPAVLAERLGDRDFHVRESADKQLDALGEAALPALRRTMATGSPEAVRRAQSLVHRITARIENDKTIAPKLVTLDLRDAGFATVADAIHKQTGYRLKIDCDATAARKTVTLRLANRPFWEAVGEIEKQLGLEVAESENALREECVFRREGDETVKRFRSLLETLETKKRNARLRLSTLNLQDWLEANKEVADATTTILRYQERLEGIEARMKTPPRPLEELIGGTVTLRARRGDRLVASTTHAVRIEVASLGHNLSRIPKDELPLLLTVFPEPELRLIGDIRVLVTRAIATDGRRLSFDPVSPRIDTSDWVGEPTGHGRNQVWFGDGVRRDQEVVRFETPAGKPVSSMKVVEGIVRATVLVDERLRFDLAESKRHETVVARGGRLGFYLSTEGRSQPQVIASLTYPFGLSGEFDGAARATVDPTRLHLTDANGGTYRLKQVETGRLVGGNSPTFWWYCKHYDVTPTKPGQGPPTKLVWSVPVLKEIEVPFKLTDVPVAAGTCDPNAKPEHGRYNPMFLPD